jgi:predicted RNase H-like HicB family nuclease
MEKNRTVLAHRYEVIVFWSNEDEVFIADRPELLGCKAHAITSQEALTHAREVIDISVDIAQSFQERRLCFKSTQ